MINGLKLINKELPNAKIYIITNQSGVAIKEFPLLTKKKAEEVCNYIVNLIRKKHVKIEKCFFCPHTDKKYIKIHPQFTFDMKMICDCQCSKPKPGMIKWALREEGWNKRDTKIYVIGDRMSDVKTAHNIKGFGILVPFINRPGEKKMVRKMKNKNKFIAKDFYDAAKFIVKKEK